MSATPTQKTSGDDLASLIVEKHRCLTDIHEIGVKQREIVAEGDVDQLLDLLARKQRLIDRLDGVERRLAPFRNDDREPPTWRDEGQRNACAKLARQCEVLLREILAQEQESATIMKNRREATGHRLHGAHQGLQTRGAYAKPRPESTSLDISSDR